MIEKAASLARPDLFNVLDYICILIHDVCMDWSVELHDDLVPEFNELAEAVRDELLAQVALLEKFGPHLGRPRVDTLNGSRHANMKELRFTADDGVWRFAFAFDPRRRAIVLCGGDKSGGGEKRFYRQLIQKADERFDAHLAKMKAAEPAALKQKGKKR